MGGIFLFSVEVSLHKILNAPPYAYITIGPILHQGTQGGGGTVRIEQERIAVNI